MRYSSRDYEAIAAIRERTRYRRQRVRDLSSHAKRISLRVLQGASDLAFEVLMNEYARSKKGGVKP